MKQLIKTTLLLGIVVFTTLVHTDKVEAKSTKIISLDYNKTYNYDLNGDGKKEKIKCIWPDYGIKHIVIINGKKSLILEQYGTGDINFELIDINRKDKYMEIYAENDGGFYRYNGKKLVLYSNSYGAGDLSRWFALNNKQDGDGIINMTIQSPGDSAFFECYFAEMQFCVKKGTLTLIKKDSYSVSNEDNHKDSAKKKVIAYTTKGGRTKAFTLKKGAEFTLIKVSIKRNLVDYAYVKNLEGKKGWIKVPSDSEILN